MEERETHDELRSESWIVLSQRLENPDSCSLLDAVGDVDVDVGDVPWRGEKWESEISRIRNETSFLFALRIRLDDSLSEDIGDGVQIQPGSLLSVLCKFEQEDGDQRMSSPDNLSLAVPNSPSSESIVVEEIKISSMLAKMTTSSLSSSRFMRLA